MTSCELGSVGDTARSQKIVVPSLPGACSGTGRLGYSKALARVEVLTSSKGGCTVAERSHRAVIGYLGYNKD